MTPKEKAKELVDKFSDYSETWDYTNDQPLECNYAEQCALIAADEVLLFIKIQIGYYESPEFIYWKEVKQEIEKI